MAVNTLTLSHTGGRQSPEYTRYIGNDKLLTITDTPLAPLVSSTTMAPLDISTTIAMYIPRISLWSRWSQQSDFN